MVPERHHGGEASSSETAVVNELDAAYEAIPEAERGAWCERADRALEAAGMPEWMRITPTDGEATARAVRDEGNERGGRLRRGSGDRSMRWDATILDQPRLASYRA